VGEEIALTLVYGDNDKTRLRLLVDGDGTLRGLSNVSYVDCVFARLIFATFIPTFSVA
jgi:hypothetical protein